MLYLQQSYNFQGSKLYQRIRSLESKNYTPQGKILEKQKQKLTTTRKVIINCKLLLYHFLRVDFLLYVP